MIYDHRTYSCRPGTIKNQLALYGEFGWPAQTRILGQPVLFASTETGDVNSYIHIWRYRDATERMEKRKILLADPDWQLYLQKSAEAGNLVSQTNCILTDAPFFTPA